MQVNRNIVELLALMLVAFAIDRAVNYEASRNLSGAGIIVVSLLNIYLYGSRAWAAFKQPSRRDYWRFQMGHVIAWSGVGGAEGWRMAIRWEGSPSWMIENGINWFFAFLVAYGGWLMYSAGNTLDPEPTPSRIYQLVIAALIGAAAMALILPYLPKMG